MRHPLDRQQPNPPANAGTDPSLTHLLSAKIRERVGGRIREIQVVHVDGCILVRGRVESYYAWQLAIAACHEVLSQATGCKLDCSLKVDDCPGNRKPEVASNIS